MPQPKKGPRLGSGPSHQRQMLSSLAGSLFEHERIKTTEAKAKMLRPFAERLITKAKKGSVHHRRQVLAVIEDRALVHKLFADIGPRFADRNGGYTRILKLGQRNGDGAPMALIELVDEGIASVVTGTDDDDDETTESGRRRRLRAPRRKGRGDLPQDKPARSRAADASAAGSSDGPDVESPDEVAEETQEAVAEAEEASTEASSEEAVESDPVVTQEASAGEVSEGDLPEKKE